MRAFQNMNFKSAPIPPARGDVFIGGISHPDLWLWDSWTLDDPSEELHLYCLALSKTSADGTPVTPPERNDYMFHVRHFVSSDQGLSWRDKGAILCPGQVADGADARNVWSGSAHRLNNGRIAYAFTGIRERGADRSFLQTICVATGPDAFSVDTISPSPISCPERDYGSIVEKGYYLGPLSELGDNSGEDGGPIMAWRDPFLFEDDAGGLHAIWSAKIAATIPAIAHAKLKQIGDQILLDELSSPIELPDASCMTQAEVPKLYRDCVSGDWLLLVSACDRRYEGQPDRELTHYHRLYRSEDMLGPWQTISPESSKLYGLDGRFGGSIIAHDLVRGSFTILAPFTENAGPEKQLQFANPTEVFLELKNVAEPTKLA